MAEVNIETKWSADSSSKLTGSVQHARGKRGMSAIFTVLVAITMFAIFTAAVGNLAIQRMRGSSRGILQQRANYACEAGFVMATEWLEQQIRYSDTANTLTFNPVDPTNFNLTHTNVSLTSDPEVRVTVRITANLFGANNITGPDAVNIEPGQVYISTLGVVGGSVAPATSRHLGGLASLGTQNFPYAIQCEGPIVLDNSNVSTFSSFDSRVGHAGTPIPMFWQYHKLGVRRRFGIPVGPKLTTYNNALASGGAGAGGGPLMPSNFVNSARIVSNSRVNAITLNNSLVDGPLYFGPGGNPATAVSVSIPQIWVAQAPQPSTAPLYLTKYKPPVDPSTVTRDHLGGNLAVSPGTYYRDVKMNGGTLTLNCGPGTNTFYFARDVELNNVDVVIPNPDLSTRAKVYVGSKLLMDRCWVNRECGSWNPLKTECHSWSFNLLFLGCGAGGIASSPSGQTIVNITNSDAWCLLAGSSMNVTLNNSSFGGAIKCNALNMTDSNMWYDVGVNANTNGIDLSRTLWGRVSWTMSGVTDYGDSLYNLAQSGGLGAAGCAAAAAGMGGAVSASNLGGNFGGAVAAPNVVTVGSPANAAAGSTASVSTSPSFWASLILGQ